MKKIFVIILMMFATAASFAQTATPAAQIRHSDTSTVFGVNIAKGTTVYFIAEKMYFACDAPVAGTASYHSARTSFTQVGGTGMDGVIKTVKAADGSAITVTGTASDKIIGVATATTSTAGVASFYNNDFNVETGAVTIDYANGQTATTSVQGFMSAAQVTALNGKVTGNGAITGSTKTKITYDSKGLVTGGADATTADIAASTDKRYVTDAQLTVIGNTSGTNTGDETNTTIKTKLGAATTSTDGYLTSTNFNTFNNKQAALVSGTNIKTINGASILASGDLALETAFTSALVDYELTADSSVSCHVALAGTPVAGSVKVTLNGATIPYDATKAKGWAIVGSKIRVKGPVYQYEKIQISYNY